MSGPPRERLGSRERLRPLAFLIVGLAVAWLPQAGRLPVWVGIALGAALIFRYYLAWAGKPLPTRLVLALPTLVGGYWVVTTFRPFFGGPGAWSLLTIATVLKLFEMRTKRDRVVAVMLGYIMVATYFTTQQTLLTAVWMCALVALFTFVMVEYGDEQGSRPALVNARVTTKLLVQSLPVLVALFILFPRHGGPLWTLSTGSGGTTGLSGQMTPGSITKLAESDELAFRVEFTGVEAARGPMYWRGPVLEEFDGVTWQTAYPQVRNPDNLPVVGERRIEQKITLEPHGRKWLFALDVPLKSDRGRVDVDLLLRSRAKVHKRMSYEVTSGELTFTGSLSELALERNLALPRALSGRVRELAQSFALDSTDDGQTVGRIFDYYATDGFVYTLEPPAYTDDFVDQFLFEGREGFCGHFAASMAVLLRANGIPARIVTGYLGGDFNPFGNYWMVPQRYAHAWVEVWLDGKGWSRYDPTAAVSQERLTRSIDRDSSLIGGAIDFFELGERFPDGFMSRLRFTFDYLELWWHKYVIDYTKQRQLEIFKNFFSARNFIAGLAGVALLAVLGWLGAITLLALWRERRTMAPVDRIWRLWLAKLYRQGLEKQPHEGPIGFAARAGERYPGDARLIMSVARLYARCKYGPECDAELLGNLKAAVADFSLTKKQRNVSGGDDTKAA